MKFKVLNNLTNEYINNCYINQQGQVLNSNLNILDDIIVLEVSNVKDKTNKYLSEFDIVEFNNIEYNNDEYGVYTGVVVKIDNKLVILADADRYEEDYDDDSGDMILIQNAYIPNDITAINNMIEEQLEDDNTYWQYDLDDPQLENLTIVKSIIS